MAHPLNGLLPRTVLGPGHTLVNSQSAVKHCHLIKLDCDKVGKPDTKFYPV